MTSAWSTASAPATLSNFGPGFDCFGAAMEAPRDVVRVRTVPQPGVRIAAITGADLPHDADRNTASVAASSLWQRAGGRGGLELTIDKGWPPGSGLGSSAASAAAAAVATAALLEAQAGTFPDRDMILNAALDGEAVVSGARHGDNVMPAVLGGFVIVGGIDPIQVERVPLDAPPWVAAVQPDLVVATKEARASLPPAVPLTGAVANVANAALVILGLVTGDLDLVARGLTDALVEPHRAALVPGYDAVRRAALDAGAAACRLSGSGPAMFALASSPALAHAAATAMVDAFGHAGLEASSWTSRLGATGARREQDES